VLLLSGTNGERRDGGGIGMDDELLVDDL